VTRQVETARQTCESVVAAAGLELVEFSFAGRMLQVTIDRPGGPLPVDEIARVSEQISRALDLADPIAEPYTLEVASAGLERPLVKPADYARFAGRGVRVRCEHPVEGRRNFTGTIRSAGEATFVLDLDDGSPAEIAYELVTRAKLVVDWDRELKSAGA
jgi:ribosome maturation factor RimP